MSDRTHHQKAIAFSNYSSFLEVWQALLEKLEENE
jgi:sterol desaturase/sphingolipid hydroxylase (fatty acid hydroxylase superfamily)